MNILKNSKIRLVFILFVVTGLSGCLDECNDMFFAPKGCFPQKNVEITPDCATQPLTTAEASDGWELMFTGNDLEEKWQIVASNKIQGWNNIDGCINFYERKRDPLLSFLDGVFDFAYDLISPPGNTIKARPFRNLVTKDQYQNFEFKADWKISKGGNSGIHFRGNPLLSWADSMEMQITDAENHPTKSYPGWLINNNVMVSDESIKTNPNPYGEWNSSHIIADGSSIKIYLNGEETFSGEITDRLGKGVIAFQDHWNEVSFKNVKLKNMD